MSIVEQPPIAWWWNPDVDAATLGQMLTNNKGRLITMSPFIRNHQLRLAAVWVSNTGAQAQGWWWNPNVDAKTLGKMLDDNKGRLVCLSPFVAGGKLRFAAAWVHNAGKHNKAWWWHPQVSHQNLSTMLANNKGRLVCLNSYLLGGKRWWSGVWIKNVSADAMAWGWKPGVNGAGLGKLLNEGQGRLLSIDPYVAGNELRFAAVWVHNAGAHARNWYWYLGVQADFLGPKFDLFCTYAVDLRSYVAGGKRQLACVQYGYPSQPNPATAKLVQVSGNAQLKQLTNNIAALEQTNSLAVTLKNLTQSHVSVGTAEMLVSEAGGWVDYRAPLYGTGALFGSNAKSLTPGATQNATKDIWSGLCTTHCVIRMEAVQGAKRQYSHTSIPIRRSGFTVPENIQTPEPVYIGAWTKPAEIVPMWLGKKSKWLTVAGQIVNGSKDPARIGAWHIFLQIDGKVYLDEPLPMSFHRMNSKNVLVPVPEEAGGIPVLSDFTSFFVHGFELANVPAAFKKGTLRLILNYKVGRRCGAAVFESPVAMMKPVTLKSPVSGTWWWGNAPNHTGFDGHAWPWQRFAYDLVIRDSDGKTFSGDAGKNSSYFCYGESVLALKGGKVVKSRDSEAENFGNKPNGKTDVNYILIEHGPSELTGYYHLRPGKNKVKVGDTVSAGDVLGEVGNSGGSSEPHLHIALVQVDKTGRGRLVPMQFSGLQAAGNATVSGVPGNDSYASPMALARVVAPPRAALIAPRRRKGDLWIGPRVCRISSREGQIVA